MFCCRWPSFGLFVTFNHFCAGRQTISISDTCKCLFTTRTIRNDDKSCSFCEGLQVARLFPIVLVQFVTWPWPWMPTVLKRIKCNFLCCEMCENVRNRTSADAQNVFYLRRALGSCCTHSTQIDATLATFEANTRIIAHCMGVKVGFIVHLKHPVHIFLLYFAIFLHKYASVATVHNESVLTLK